MQVKTISERELVKMAMEELCKKAGFKDSRGMVQRDLEFLADSIESRTGILISLSTIKRLIHGEFSRQPQVATLNAIAVFLDYTNWQNYKLSAIRQPEVVASNQNDQKETKLTFRSQKSFYKRYLLVAGVVVLSTLGLLAILKFRKPGLANISNAQFSARKTTSNDLPNTVVFNYNVDGVIADSFFIQQSWDKSRRVRISKKNYTLTDIYYEPGYHVAKLIANEKVIKTLDVSIPTDRWFFYAQEETPASQPKYIRAETGINTGSLQLNPQAILNSQVDMKKDNKYIQVYFPTKIESSSDDFTMKFKLRVTPLNNDFCPYFMAELFCQKNFMFFTSTPKGCANKIIIQFGENYRNGKTNDFSSLASDPEAWQEVELTNKNKNVSIRINTKEVFSTTYQISGGLITGIGFISNGLVEVDYVSLKTANGKDIYTNDFE
jgi:hypothetical protein